MSRWSIKVIAKELIFFIVTFFILSYIINYLRYPSINNERLAELNVRLIDGSIYVKEPSSLLVIHFWATWCPTCRLEASNIDTISKKYNLLSVAVNSGSDIKLKEYMHKNGLNFKVVNDRDGILAKKFGVEFYPTTFIYDLDDKLRFVESGYTTTVGMFARLKWLESK